MKSTLDANHKQKEKKNLLDFKIINSMQGYENDEIFENAYIHEDVQRFLFIDEKNKVAAYLEINENIIPFLKVSLDYQSCNLGFQLLDLAVKKFGAKYLSCSPMNHIALRMYLNYGFKITEESKEWVKKDPLHNLYRLVYDGNKR